MPRILVVDDDPDILDIIRLDLEDDPANNVDICSSGREALLLAGKNKYDVIITDMRMPKITGLDLIRELRAMECNSVVVVYSGQGMGSEIREALEIGADYYVRRGGDPDNEFSELKKIIKKSG